MCVSLIGAAIQLVASRAEVSLVRERERRALACLQIWLVAEPAKSMPVEGISRAAAWMETEPKRIGKGARNDNFQAIPSMTF